MSAPGITRANDYVKVIHLRGDFDNPLSPNSDQHQISP